MASTTLENIMRFSPQTHNAKIVVSAGTGTATISLKTYDGLDHQADSPLLIRFEDLSTSDTYVPVATTTIDAADTFALPDNFSDLTPLYVGLGYDAGTIRICVSLADTIGNVTTVTAATENYHTLSSAVFTGKVIWIGKIIGFTRSAGVYSFSSATVIYESQ